MAKYAVEVLIKSGGGAQAKAAMEGVGAGARGATPAVEKLAKDVLGLEINLRGFGALAAKAFAGFQVIAVGRRLLEETKSAATAQALLTSAVRSTGAAAGYNADQLDQMAGRLSALNGIDDEAIAGAEALMLRYERISGEIFPAAIQAAIDMASASGKQIQTTDDLTGSVERLAKILGDPIRAINLLKREGKGLDETQIKLIQNFIRHNDLLGAQKVLLAEVNRLYGGTAVALRNEVGGAIQAVDVAWGNLLEEFGKGLTVDTSGVNNLADTLTDPKLLTSVHEIGAGLGTIAGGLVKITGLLGPLLTMLIQIEQHINPLLVLQRLIGQTAAGGLKFKWPGGSGGGAGGGWGGGEGGKKQPPPLPPPDLEALRREQAARERLLELADKAVAAAALELRDQEALLHARTLSVEAMKLEQTIQDAIAKARAAGAGATSKQRIEIIQLSLATAAAKSGIERMNEAEAALPGLFSASNKKLLEQLDALIELDEVLKNLRQVTADFQADVNAANAAQVEAGGAEMAAAVKAQLEAAKQISAYLREPVESAARYMRDTILDNIAAAATGAKVSWKDMFQQMLQMWIRALIEMLARWIAVQGARVASAQAADAKIAASGAAASAAGGGGGGGFGGGMGGMFSGAGRAMMGNPMLASGGSYSAYGTALWGAVVVGAMFAIKNWIRQQGVRDGHATLGVEGGRVTSSQSGKYIGASAKAQMKADELAATVAATLNQIMTSLGGAFESLAADLRIGRHGQGKKAYYTVKFLDAAGKLVELRFKEFDAAMEAAVIQALRTSQTFGLSSEVQAALRNTTAETLDQLKQDIDTAMAAVHARLGATGSQVYDTFRSYEQQIVAARKLELATDALVAARERDIASIRNSLLGVDTSTADFLASLASYNRGILEATTATRQATETQLAAAQANLDSLLASGPQRIEGEGGRGYTQTQDMWEREVARVRGQVARYIDELDKIPKALSDQEINMGIFDALYKYLEGNQKYSKQAVEYARMKVEIEFAAIKAQLIALGKWEEFAAMFDDAYRAAREAAGKPRGGRGGGGRAGARESALDELADMRARAAGGIAETMLQYARAVREWNKAAKEGKLTAEQRAEGERLLRQEMQRTLQMQARELAGMGTDFTARLAEGAKFFEDLRAAGRGKTGIPNWLLDFMQGKFFDRMKGEFQGQLASFFGFSNELADNAAQADQLRQNLAALAATGKLSAEEIAAALGQIEQALGLRNQLAIAGLMNKLFEPLKDSPKWAAEAAKWKRVELDLQYEILKAQLIAYGLWEEAADIWAAARDAAHEQLEAAKASAMSAREYAAAVAQDKAMVAGAGGKNLDEAKRILESWKAAGESGIMRDLRSLGEELAIVKAAYGENAEVVAAYSNKLNSVLRQYIEPITRFREGRQLSNLSTLTGEQKFYEAQKGFRDLIGSVLGGDLSKIDQVVSMAQQYGDLAKSFTAGQGVRFIMKEIDDALLKLEQTVPGIATAAAGVPLGSASNPMRSEAPGTVSAINQTTTAVNNGNTLLLNELREMKSESREQTDLLQQLNTQQGVPFSKKVA